MIERTIVLNPGDTVKIECYSNNWVVLFGEWLRQKHGEAVGEERAMFEILGNLTIRDVDIVKMVNKKKGTSITTDQFRKWLSHFMASSFSEILNNKKAL
jgi:hypothetical protein